MQSLNVQDFRSADIKNIQKYLDLNTNLSQIETFLQNHTHDINISTALKNKISQHINDSSIDKKLLTSLIYEHKSRYLVKKVEEEQKTNTNSIEKQFRNNVETNQSIFLHQQAQSLLHSLKIDKEAGLFKSPSDQWIVKKIATAEQYIIEPHSSRDNTPSLTAKQLTGGKKRSIVGSNSRKDNKRTPPGIGPRYESHYKSQQFTRKPFTRKQSTGRNNYHRKTVYPTQKKLNNNTSRTNTTGGHTQHQNR